MELATAVDAVNSAIDTLARVAIDSVGGSELRSELARLKAADSRLEAQLGRLTHAADACGAFIGTGARDTAEWLGKETGTSTRANRSASELGEAMTKSDELAAAVTSGRLSTDKATAAVGAARGRAIDDELLAQIADVPLHSVRPAAEAWRARHDADGERDVASSQRARRFLKLTSVADGMTRVDGLLDPESAATVRTTLDAVMNESAFDGTSRSRDQRCADALTQLAAAASKGNIAGGRSNAKLLATVPFETIVERAEWRGVTHAGPTLDANTIRKLACDAGIHRVVTGPHSSIIDFGHENRLVSENLFLALVARDQRCRWPGCTVRAAWCDAHHVVEWDEQHGRTSEQHCALLCNHHHHVTHLPGWSVTGDGHEFVIHHPDGSTETSRPPAAAGRGAATTPTDHPVTHPPPAGPLRADRIGRHESVEAAPVSPASASATPGHAGPSRATRRHATQRQNEVTHGALF